MVPFLVGFFWFFWLYFFFLSLRLAHQFCCNICSLDTSSHTLSQDHSVPLKGVTIDVAHLMAKSVLLKVPAQHHLPAVISSGVILDSLKQFW